MNDTTWNKENLWQLLTSEDEANVALARQMLKGVPFVLAKELITKSELYWRLKRIFYDSLVVLARCEEHEAEEFATEDFLGAESEALKNYWIRSEDIMAYHQQKLSDTQLRQLLRWRVWHNVPAYTKEDEARVLEKS